MTNSQFANHYTIQRELGRGSFGIVYLANDTALGNRALALKVLHPQLATDPASLRLFVNEAGILANLRHDHIVTVYEAGLWQGQRYLAMELIEGMSLAQLIEKEGAQPPIKVGEWLRQAAEALAYAHDRGVLHRDLKSANLLWEQSRDRIYIVDFGLAQAVEQSGGSSIETTQQMTGTAAYRAPEVRTTGHTVTSDLYSLGVVAYELLAGRRPFLGVDPFDIGMAHINDRVPPLPSGIPEPLARLVLRLLAKEPKNRLPSAHRLVEELQRMANAPSRSLDTSAVDVRLPTESPYPQPAALVDEPPHRRRRKPSIHWEARKDQPPLISPVVFLGGMAALVVILILLYLALSSGLSF